MVGTAVVIDEDGHVAAHLSALHVAPEIHAFLYLTTPGGCPPFFPFLGMRLLSGSHLLFCHIERPASSMQALATQKAERSCGTVALGEGYACSLVATTLQLQMKKYDKALCLRTEEHLGALHDAAALDVAARLAARAECHALTVPVRQVFRRIDTDADVHSGTTVGALLAIPVVGIAMFQDTAAMGVDMLPVGIGPRLSVHQLRRCQHGKEQQKE